MTQVTPTDDMPSRQWRQKKRSSNYTSTTQSLHYKPGLL